MSTLKIILITTYLSCNILYSANLSYPQYIHIKKFATEENIYKPGMPVVFTVEFTSTRHLKKIDIQIWIDSKLKQPLLVASKKVDGTYKLQLVELKWSSTEKSVFGHKATIKFIDPQGRLLAEDETLFNVSNSLEIDSHHKLQDGLYPLTYKKMSIALNNIIEVTGRYIMPWAYVASQFYDEYSVAFIRPYMAIIFASRTKLQDHFGAYAEAWILGSESPASKQFIKYNRFMARYSWYLWDPKLKWVLNPNKDFTISASRPLFWDRLVYERDLGKGKKQRIINILNLPSNGNILTPKEIPPIAQNISLKIKSDQKISRVFFLDADKENLKPLLLKKNYKEKTITVYRIPPITCWSLIIINIDKQEK